MFNIRRLVFAVFIVGEQVFGEEVASGLLIDKIVEL